MVCVLIIHIESDQPNKQISVLADRHKRSLGVFTFCVVDEVAGVVDVVEVAVGQTLVTT